MARFRNAESLFSLFLLLVGTGVLSYASYSGILERGRPGPGMFPFLAGLLMAAASAGSLWKAYAGGEAEPRGESVDLGMVGRIALILAAMIGLVLLAEPLGLLIASTAMMVLIGLTCRAEPLNRRFVGNVIVVSILFGIANHLFFKYFLKVPLPEGLFGLM